MKLLERVGEIDIAPLRDAIADHAPDFDLMTFRQDWHGTPHSDTQTLYLRMPATISVETIFEAADCQDWSLMTVPAFRDAVHAVAKLACGEPARAMIVKLRAGGKVARHSDQGGYAAATERFHLAIDTNDRCLMHVGDETAYARPGEVYFFDKRFEHEVINDGPTDRIHLILDVWKDREYPVAIRIPSVTYQEERFTAVRPEIAGLMTEHWREVTDNPDIPLDPDWDWFGSAEDLDLIKVMTARSDGVLIGYIVFLLATLPHYRTHLGASDDAFFLKREHRKGMIGVKMFRESEKMLASYGVNRIIYHEKNNTPTGKVFRYLGYKPTETLWTKELQPQAVVRTAVKRPKQTRTKPLRRISIV